MRIFILLLTLTFSCFADETLWVTNLDEPIKAIKKSIDPSKQSQTDLTISHNNLAFLYNAKLKILYAEVVASLKTHEEISVLKKEQTEWLNSRTKKFSAISKESGSMAPMLAAIEHIKITKARILVLKKRNYVVGRF